jgi:hypothetical protein
MLPITMSFTGSLRLAKVGYIINKFYTPTRTSSASPRWFYTILTYLMIMLMRLYGFRYPFPQHVPLDEPLPIAQWIATILQHHKKCLLRGSISKAVRICLVAEKHNLNLQGLYILVGGEPISKAKVEILERNGVKHIPVYSFNEAGMIGLGCINSTEANNLHHTSHHTAIIQRPIEIFDQTVNAFCFTTLHPSGPKMLLNAQSDDYGLIEKRDCGCPLYDLGFHYHLNDVHSYRKLTTEGTTLIGSDIVYILEKILPDKFGGSLLDYQLVEEEENGITRLFLYVDPSIAEIDEQVLINGFLEALKESDGSAQLAQSEYRQANTIMIRRQTPIKTSRNKHFAIRTLKQSQSN